MDADCTVEPGVSKQLRFWRQEDPTRAVPPIYLYALSVDMIRDFIPGQRA